MPSMPPALVGFREVRAIYTSNSVIEMSLRVNAGVGSSSMEGRTNELRCIIVHIH